MSELTSYILRIPKEELERMLFCRRIFYVNISRGWSYGMSVLFVKKDMFIGSGLIERFIVLDDMEELEKKNCIENNMYGKITFARLARFVPSLLVQATPAASQNPLALHGASMSSQDVMRIERMAAGRIVS